MTRVAIAGRFGGTSPHQEVLSGFPEQATSFVAIAAEHATARVRPMNDASRQAHWQNVYRSKAENEVSWFQAIPAPSLELIDFCRTAGDAAIVDIGGGASRLVDELLARGFSNLTVLDLSEAALAAVKARLGDKAAAVQWIVADITEWAPTRLFDIWHDRAAFHFLTDPGDRAAYIACLDKAIKPGGSVIIGTFAPDGPEKCSGLPVHRYDDAGLAEVLGSGFELLQTRRHEHATPWGAIQRFQFSLFRKA
jgi:SAM-dependent methyltransferase